MLSTSDSSITNKDGIIENYNMLVYSRFAAHKFNKVKISMLLEKTNSIIKELTKVIISTTKLLPIYLAAKLFKIQDLSHLETSSTAFVNILSSQIKRMFIGFWNMKDATRCIQSIDPCGCKSMVTASSQK